MKRIILNNNTSPLGFKPYGGSLLSPFLPVRFFAFWGFFNFWTMENAHLNVEKVTVNEKPIK